MPIAEANGLQLHYELAGDPAAPPLLLIMGLGMPAAAWPEGLVAYLVRHGLVAPEKAQQMISVQGVKMLRPSRIHIAITGDPQEITDVRVGGTAVIVGEGHVRL